LQGWTDAVINDYSERTVPKDYPDHHDAELVIKFYELRRDPLMREARNTMAQFVPKTFDEIAVALKPDHPANAALRQVTSYWEMVYGMAAHGIIHPEFLLESNGEGIFIFSRFERFLEQYRAASGPRAFKHTEWIANNTELGKALLARHRGRLEALLAAK
jgi:hypothetical protein